MTVVAVGHLVHDALAVADELVDEVSVEVFDPRTLYPFDWELLASSLGRTRRLVLFDDSNRTCGFAAEVVATATEELHPRGTAEARHAGRHADRVRRGARARRAPVAPAARGRRACGRRGAGGVIEVHIPKAGMSTVEVDVIAVHVAAGDPVEPDTVLIEVESEKATFDVEAGHTGTVGELLVEEGDEVKVGDVIARIEPAAAA